MATKADWNKRSGRSSSFIRRSTRFAIYARDNFDCVYCRGQFPPRLNGKGLTLDHVKPRSEGGTNTPENIVTACPKCNSTKQHRKIKHLDPVQQRKVNARVRRALKKPINRELGRWLAHIAKLLP